MDFSERRPPVLLVNVEQVSEPLTQQFGSVQSWYERAWGGPLYVRDGRERPFTLDARKYRAILITGSPASVCRWEPWMDDAAALVLCAHEFGIPVLGVCFGHQLVAHAFGARVIPNPKGFEVGTRDVYVNDCGRGDPLFQGLAAQLRVNLIHRDKVDFESLSGSAVRVLAGSELCDVQALAIGESIRTLQFHPEMSGELCRALVREVVPRDPGAMTATTQDTPDGFQVIRNFRRCFVEGGA